MQKSCTHLVALGGILVSLTALPAGLQAYGATIMITSVPTDAPGENMASEHIRGTVTDGDPRTRRSSSTRSAVIPGGSSLTQHRRISTSPRRMGSGTARLTAARSSRPCSWLRLISQRRG